MKSKKSKSKRSTLKHKYKVIKKVKQHLKKKAKEEKVAKKAGKTPKAKDPGIPSQWPFKEELLKDLEWQKQRIAAQEKAKKDEKKLKRAAEKEAEVENDERIEPVSAEDLQNYASRMQDEFNAKKRARLDVPIGHVEKDGSRRAYFKEFVKCVTASDVIIEVLDARDPLSSRCTDAEKFIRRSGSNKKIILLLNKIDLVPRENAESWLKYLREELPTVAFKCSTQRQTANLKQRKTKGSKHHKPVPVAAGHQMSDCLGAETLLQLLKNYSRNLDIKTGITVDMTVLTGIVGFPNVGKSSLINSLKRTRVANVGNAPGVTRSTQQISLDKNINLVDSPGMVYSAPKSGDHWAALRNCIKVEQLEDPRAVVEEVLRRCPQKQLMTLYKVPAFQDSEEFLQSVAFQRGRLLPGGIGDSSSAARIVLHDWHNGKIPYYTVPPTRETVQYGDAQILASWREEFNADKVFANERNAVIGSLPSLEAEQKSFFLTESSGNAQSGFHDFEKSSGNVAKERVAPEVKSDSDSEGSDNEDEDRNVPGLSHDRPEDQNAGTVTNKDQSQTEVLYNQPGQFNPAKARADKKRQRKAKKLSLGDDFDFAEAFADEIQLNEHGEQASELTDENDGSVSEISEPSGDSDSD